MSCRSAACLIVAIISGRPGCLAILSAVALLLITPRRAADWQPRNLAFERASRDRRVAEQHHEDYLKEEDTR